MLSRLRRARRLAGHVCALFLAMVTAVLDKEDVLVLVGLGLLCGGLWEVSRAAALIVPGMILLWMFVPPRPPFIERPPARERRPAS